MHIKNTIKLITANDDTQNKNRNHNNRNDVDNSGSNINNKNSSKIATLIKETTIQPLKKCKKINITHTLKKASALS